MFQPGWGPALDILHESRDSFGRAGLNMTLDHMYAGVFDSKDVLRSENRKRQDGPGPFSTLPSHSDRHVNQSIPEPALLARKCDFLSTRRGPCVFQHKSKRIGDLRVQREIASSAFQIAMIATDHFKRSLQCEIPPRTIRTYTLVPGNVPAGSLFINSRS